LQFEAAKATAQGALLENQKILAEIRLTLAKAHSEARKGDVDDDKLIQEQKRIELEMEQNDIMREQNRIALAKLTVEREKIQAQKNKPTSK
jgi:hypothetical protein